MEHTKNILIIGDMPGYGKMGLAGMLPILSNMGHSVYNLPTALVSNNFDYGKFSVLDTTAYMEETIRDLLRAFIDSQRKTDFLVVTDPIMGDGGKLYNGSTPQTVDNMRRFVGAADVIVPNITEAEFLTGLYKGEELLAGERARRILDGLRALGPRSAVITSGREEGGRHVVWGFDGRTGEYFTVPYRFIKAHFPGTGDIFTSLLTGQLLSGRSLPQAVKKAVDLLERLIFLEQDVAERNNGIRIEKYLSVLTE